REAVPPRAPRRPVSVIPLLRPGEVTNIRDETTDPHPARSAPPSPGGRRTPIVVPLPSREGVRLTGALSYRAVQRGLLLRPQIVRGVDQAHVSECLRKISNHPLEVRIIFLGEQSQVVGYPDQALEDQPRFVGPPQHRKIV